MTQVAVVSELRCPICSRRYHEARLSVGGDAFPSCQSKTCRAKWWAFRLETGSLREQMLREFDTDVVYLSLIEQEPSLPEQILGDCYLQIILAPEVAHNTPLRGIRWMMKTLGWAA